MTSMGLERLQYSLYFKMVAREPGPGQVGGRLGQETCWRSSYKSPTTSYSRGFNGLGGRGCVRRCISRRSSRVKKGKEWQHLPPQVQSLEAGLLGREVDTLLGLLPRLEGEGGQLAVPRVVYGAHNTAGEGVLVRTGLVTQCGVCILPSQWFFHPLIQG